MHLWGCLLLLRRLLLRNTPTICFANCSPHTPSKGCLCEHPLQTRAKTFQKSFIKTFRPHTKVVCRRTTVVSVFFRHLTAEKPLCLIAHLRVADRKPLTSTAIRKVAKNHPHQWLSARRANKSLIFFAAR